MKTTKKVISVICVVAMLIGALSCVAVAAGDVNYTIINPYEGVDFKTYKQYKTDLHSHTTQSDGNNTLKEQIEAHYGYDFDAYAVSDHGTVSYTWTDSVVVPTFKVGVSVKDFEVTDLECLEADGGYTSDGDKYYFSSEKLSDAEGDTQDYYWQEGSEDHKMMRVPYAIENNPTSLNNAHVNSWFADYGHGILGGTSDYETPIKSVDELGGLSVINHPGEYTSARDEEETADAYDYSNTHYAYVIDKFTNLLEKYPTCIGIDMNSKGDTRTRYDRKLWDILLMNVVPTGRNVFGICTSDSHNANIIYSGYVEMLMPELTVDALKNCMANGQFFGCSKYIGNPEELTEIANYCVNSGNKTATRVGQQILDAQKENAKCKYEADLAIDAPVINNVVVDDDADTITINAKGALCIRWIANGETIAYGDKIDLDDYSSDIGSYVRAEIFGEGGIVYTQAFMLKYTGAPSASKDGFIDFWFLASFIPDSLIKLLGALPIFEIIWGWIQG